MIISTMRLHSTYRTDTLHVLTNLFDGHFDCF